MLDKREEQAEQVAKDILEHWNLENVYDNELKEHLNEQFSYRYPYQQMQKWKMKFTVSELKKRTYLSEESSGENGEEMIEEEDYDRDSNIDTGKHRMDEYMSAGEYSLSFHKAKLNDDGSAVLDEDGNYEEGSETTIAEFNVPEMQGEISLNY